MHYVDSSLLKIHQESKMFFTDLLLLLTFIYVFVIGSEKMTLIVHGYIIE